MISTRIAPSPTGFLHIGPARTALFNWLYARKLGGKFRLRIEDTDGARNNQESVDSIIRGLEWLGLDVDEEVVFQSKNVQKHQEYAKALEAAGLAYYSYISVEEINRRRDECEAKNKRYMHRFSAEDTRIIDGVRPVLRFRVPDDGVVKIHDAVQGEVAVLTDTIDDFVLLRADETPVYMLSAVCDDVDMSITHVVRGDDHLTNTAKQILLYEALRRCFAHVKTPVFAHIPLIHGMDGKKLSKRHGALPVEEYRDMGYLPEALRAYLLRLGWGSENDDIMDDAVAIKAFSLERIGRSPSRFDFEKLRSINAYFIKTYDNEDLLKKCEKIGVCVKDRARAVRVIEKTKIRVNTLIELTELIKIFDGTSNISNGVFSTPEAQRAIEFFDNFIDSENNLDGIDARFKIKLAEEGLKFSQVGPFVRTALAGDRQSLGVFDIIYIIGFEEARRRVCDALSAI